MKQNQRFIGTLLAVLVSATHVLHAAAATKTPAISQSASIRCAVYPSVPGQLQALSRVECRATQTNRTVFLNNGFISVEISADSGVITAVGYKLTKQKFELHRDETGFSLTNAGGKRVEWFASPGERQKFEIVLMNKPGNCTAILTTSARDDAAKVTLKYTLGKSDFWVERRLSVESGNVNYDRLCYGRAEIAHRKVRNLTLGKFDAPRLISAGNGGVFAGVGWWFYEVKDGAYQNAGMNYETAGRFDAEPWYVGVFRPEPGEPYPGWFWYKTFLSERKLAYDKQRSYFLWNARSGYSFQPINNSDLLTFVDTAASIGLDGITAGQVRGLSNGIALAATDATARKVIDTFARQGMTFGVHEGDVGAKNWESEAALTKKLQDIERAGQQGFRNLTVDFLRITDRFADHRRATAFFRQIREKMAYTECHLGMAAYGPQFQREVLINHPTDLKNFDISRFSADWATLMGFRQSRRTWQQKYDYLMPENGLFYFSTHYSNYPRRYIDPEPQQFLYIADAWRGLAYAFHDKFGFRDCVAAQSAFTTFYVFGFLDSQIPKRDAELARGFRTWTQANTDVLSRGRVCYETEDALVMSKIQDGRGAVFALNYTPGQKHFKLNFEINGNAVRVQQVYPVKGKLFQIAPGRDLEIDVPGERLAIFEINDGLNGLPPENPGQGAIDITNWKRTGETFESSFLMPDIRAQLAEQKDKTLPQRVASADQVETEFVTTKPAGKSFGRLPRQFLDVHGFEDDKYLPTWQVAPWAFADRLWLVYVPKTPPTIVEGKPVVRLNGKEISMKPRVRYNPHTKLAHPEKWDVPMWFADVTEACIFGGRNSVILSGIRDASPGACFIAGSPK